MKARLFLVLGVLMWAVSSQAYWFGNPAQPLEDKNSGFEIIYETGERDIKNTNGGPTSELSNHRVILQGRTALSRTVQLIGRGVPGVGRINFQNSSFNPALWAVGAGLQLSPPEAIADRIRLGAVAYYDWTFGATDRPAPQTGNDKITWAEGSVAAGASVNVIDMLDVYAGLSLVKPDINVDYGGVETNLEADEVFGAFIGLTFTPHEAWRMGSEAHFGNEDTLGFVLSYLF